MAGEPGAEAEVDVLEVGEELLVEQTDVGEQGGAEQARPTAGREHLAGLPHRLGRLIAVARERQAPHRVEVAGAVDRPPVAHQQPTGGDRHAGLGVEHGRQRRQPPGVGDGVVVEQGDRRSHPTSMAWRMPRLTPPAKPRLTSLRRTVRGTGAISPSERVEHGDRVVDGSVVDDDDLEVVVILGGERANARTEVDRRRSSSGRRWESPSTTPLRHPRHAAVHSVEVGAGATR